MTGVQTCALPISDKIAAIEGARQSTFAELDRAADRFAGALAASGVGKGARVAIMAPNILEYPVVVFGAVRAGAIVCCISGRVTADDLAYMLNKAGAEIVVAFADSLPVVAAARGATRVREVVAIGAPDGTSTPFAAFMERGDGRPLPVAVEETDPVGMTFTGGTTGFPKAVTVTHRNRYASCEIGRAHV